MAILRTGSLTVTTGGVAQNLVLGAIPSHFKMYNTTTLTSAFLAEWWNTMPNASGLLWSVGATPAFTLPTTNMFTPFTTADNQLWVPNQAPYNVGGTTNLTITGISQAANASITATHSFTTADIGVTWVTFSGVVGMTQINTLRGQITGVTSTTSFTVNINSTSFTAWGSGGIANVITGAPVTTQFGSQVQMTPQHNLGVAGLTLGTTLMVNTSDVWVWEADYDTSVNG